MSSYSGPELIGFGEGGKSHWGQVNCRKCNAWLKEMPDRSRKASRKLKYKLGYTGIKSLEKGEYYAHRGNQFWRIMFVLFDEPFSNKYEKKKELIIRNNIAL